MSNLTSFDQAYELRPVLPLLPFLSDFHLALLLPIVVYWLTAFTFEWIDGRGYFLQYKLHTPAEELTQNPVSRYACVRRVIMNQVIQVLLGIAFGSITPPDLTGREAYDVAVWATRVRKGRAFGLSLLSITGVDARSFAVKVSDSSLIALLGWSKHADKPLHTSKAGAQGQNADLSTDWDTAVAKLAYWYIFPVVQITIALLVIDTYLYFVHRWEHTNKWIYKHIHSVHHRLYIPYAYGGYYTHPMEGLVVDSTATLLGYWAADLTTRQGMVLSAIVSVKVTTDHISYVFPWHPWRLLSENDTYFHDIHHQKWGLKYNYGAHTAFWDRALGTRWTDHKAAVALYDQNRKAAQRRFDSKVNGRGQIESSKGVSLG